MCSSEFGSDLPKIRAGIIMFLPANSDGPTGCEAKTEVGGQTSQPKAEVKVWSPSYSFFAFFFTERVQWGKNFP